VSADEIFAKRSAMAPLGGFAEVIARFLMEADARGDVLAPNPMAVASLFIAAVHSLAIFEMRGGHGQGHSHGGAPIDAFVAVLWTGLTPKATEDQEPPWKTHRIGGRRRARRDDSSTGRSPMTCCSGSEHLVWGSMLLFLLTRGPGFISVDHLIARRGAAGAGAADCQAGRAVG
jgi:hypothetical protein